MTHASNRQMPSNVHGAAKKQPSKVSRCFLSSHLEFQFETLQQYLLISSTFNCQVKWDSVEKRQNYKLFNMTAYQFFSIKKCSSYNNNSIASLNSIVN